MTNSLVVYFSKFGNTKTIAETIAESLEPAGTSCIQNAEELTGADLRSLDLVLMGTPTHNMNLPKVVKPIFDELPKGCLKGVHVAAFDTSYKMPSWLSRFTAAKPLNRKLRKLGGKRIVQPETFFVMEREGPLYGGEIERAKGWAHLILERC
jgi:flavodoxin